MGTGSGRGASGRGSGGEVGSGAALSVTAVAPTGVPVAVLVLATGPSTPSATGSAAAGGTDAEARPATGLTDGSGAGTGDGATDAPEVGTADGPSGSVAPEDDDVGSDARSGEPGEPGAPASSCSEAAVVAGSGAAWPGAASRAGVLEVLWGTGGAGRSPEVGAGPPVLVAVAPPAEPVTGTGAGRGIGDGIGDGIGAEAGVPVVPWAAHRPCPPVPGRAARDARRGPPRS